MISTTYCVGMTCDHCVRSLREEVGQIDGVTRVDVDQISGAVTVQSDGPLSDESFASAVVEAGYEVAP